MSQEWTPPASYYQSEYPTQNSQQISSQIRSYPTPPPQLQGEWSIPAGIPLTPPHGVSPAHNVSSLITNPSLATSDFSLAAQLKYTIPPKYNGDIVDQHGSKTYHLHTAHMSTVLSDLKGLAISRIDWHKHASHTTIRIRHNTWHRDQLLHPNKDKTYTFQTTQHGGYTWKGFQNGIRCFDASGKNVAEFPYLITSVIRLDPSHVDLVELVIITALLLHYEQSHHKEHTGLFGKVADGATEGVGDAIGEAVFKGMFGGV